MKQPNLLSPQQNKAIVSNFKEHPLFLFFEKICLPIETNNEDFYVSASELFYHCFYTLDVLKTQKSEKEIRSEGILLWDRLVRFAHRKSLQTQNFEVLQGLCLIAYSVERCLLLSNNSHFLMAASEIETRLQERVPSQRHELQRRYAKMLHLSDQQVLYKYLSDYLCNDSLLSDQIEQIIRDYAFEEKSVPSQTQEIVWDTVSIAEPICVIAQTQDKNNVNIIRFKTDWAVILRILNEHGLFIKDKVPEYKKFCEYLLKLNILNKVPTNDDIKNVQVAKQSSIYPNWQKFSSMNETKFEKYLKIASTFIEYMNQN